MIFGEFKHKITGHITLHIPHITKWILYGRIYGVVKIKEHMVA